MLGDNGVVFLAGGYTGTLPSQGGAVTLIQTTDTAENTGGVDTMSGNAGSDVILGGVAGDLIYGDRAGPTQASLANDGDDVVLGDNGLLDFSSADTNPQSPRRWY